MVVSYYKTAEQLNLDNIDLSTAKYVIYTHYTRFSS